MITQTANRGRLMFGLSMVITLVATVTGLAADEFFEKRVRPILAERCYECHYRASKGGFQLGSQESLLRGGQSGPVIDQADATQSLLLLAITRQHAEIQMPPKKPLPQQEQAILSQWIMSGAPWPAATGSANRRDLNSHVSDEDRNFWSFKPLNWTLPRSTPSASSAHPIDSYLSIKHDQLKLSALPRASRLVLARRAYFDLLGLPPTPAELDAFQTDPAPNAFARLVDRLLADPRYGERWGGHWLDLTRYADTAGDASDFPVPEAYRYRNYVIDAFNRDKPYDDFVREQIAGDLLPYANDDERWENIVATGYVATSRRVGVSPQNLKHIVIEDTLDNIGKTFLGLTIGCARCHDHKFDPIPTADYYRLYGIFASSVYPHPGAEHQPYRRDFTYRMGKSESDKVLASYRADLAPWDAKEREGLRIYRLFQTEKISTPGLSRQSTWKDLLNIREQRRQVAETFPNLEIAYSLREGTAQDAAIMKGGNPSKRSQGETVRRGFLSILGGQKIPAHETGSGRHQLAQWLTGADNPLTYRVMANRVWHYHFGRGIVATPSDFGLRGSRPTHPELLDYLANYLQQEKGSLKALHRHIMSSDAYQRASHDHTENSTVDPTNQYLWRFNRQRVSAEQLRDTILALSGDLDTTPGREHPFPHRLTYFYRQHEPFTENYDNHKRTVYRLRRRLEKDPYLDLFDGPDGNLHLGKRQLTITTLQALYFMNGDFLASQSAKIARQIQAADASPTESLNQLFRACYARPITPDERQHFLDFLSSPEHGSAAVRWQTLVKSVLSSNEFLFID